MEENSKKIPFISFSELFAFLRNGVGLLDQERKVLKIAT